VTCNSCQSLDDDQSMIWLRPKSLIEHTSSAVCTFSRTANPSASKNSAGPCSVIDKCTLKTRARINPTVLEYTE